MSNARIQFAAAAAMLLPLLLAGCREATSAPQPTATLQPAPTPTPQVEPSGEPLPWWRTAVFYEIFVRSFYDSNDDGIGDFKGLTSKLDYLNDGNPAGGDDLGVTALWLMPIHPSPSYHGYDVVNYYAVNPDYGSLADFREFLGEAHRRGIRVILDLVLNHTSSQHPFFRSALASPESPYHAWYLWSQEDRGQGWHTAQMGGKAAYYYGYFCDCMPDLNYENPDVTQQMEAAAGFWLEKVGVDGFRIDAAKHLIEGGEAAVTNSPETHAWFKGFYDFYKGANPDAYAVGEVTSGDARLSAQYGSGELDQIFSFEMASGMVNSVKGEAVSGINSAVAFTLEDNPAWNFATFLTNHDQDRVMSVLGGSLEKARLAAFLLLASPGTPFIYYGEEIGMTGRKPDEDIRRPMQWNGEANAGFSSGSPWEEVHADASTVNVAAESANPESLLAAYRTLIALRAAHPALSAGAYLPVETSQRGVYAFLRQAGGETLLAVVNLTGQPVSDYSLSGKAGLLADGTYSPAGIYGAAGAASLTIAGGGFQGYQPHPALAPYQAGLYAIP